VAIGVRPELAQGSVVFTLNGNHAVEELEYVLEKFQGDVAKLRALSPIWMGKAATR
jgi:cysteine sulfinate desulfinase/cysteine desulfurase-like protein